MAQFTRLLDGLRAAAESTRLRLIALLAEGEMTVGEIAEVLGQSQPRVSRHLRLLAEGGLIERLPEAAAGPLVARQRTDEPAVAALHPGGAQPPLVP